MVTVIDYALRLNAEGEEFVALILQGDLEMVQSKDTGRFYATAKRCSVSSTFTEDVARKFIGKEIPGRIVRQECEPYDYTVPETGEVIQLSHSWRYTPEEPSTSKVIQPVTVHPKVQFSENGLVGRSA